LKVLPQIAVTTTEQNKEIMGYKILLCKTGTTAVNIAFSLVKASQRTTDKIQIPASTTYKFTAPKGHLFYQIFVDTDTGTSTLDVVSTDIDVVLIG
jgi:Zn/Cd-binding protein ZinT